MTAVESTPLDKRSKELRRLIFRAIENGGRGHIGPALSLVEIIRMLYDEILKVRPYEPKWPGRDRFILSKGHGCLALYAVLADKGFFPIEELDRFCHFDSILGGHPEVCTPGVEASTGALGHGLPIAVGQAMAMRMHNSDARAFVLMGDGEINEGSVWEAAAIAAKHGLGNLTALVDYNKIQSAGSVFDILPMEPLMEKWRAFGFHAEECNGHDLDDLRRVFAALDGIPQDKPRIIVCHTIKGKGVPEAEGNASWHHISRLSDDIRRQIADALQEPTDA